AFRWAAGVYGTAAGVLASVLTATWFESLYFAPKPTPDAVCGYFLLAGVFLARPAASRREIFAAGVCLLLALAIRMQIALAIADVMVRIGGSIATRRLIAVAAAWIVAGVAMSLGDTYRPYWLQDRNHILAFRAIGREPDACGVALVGIRWWHTPGYSGMGR